MFDNNISSALCQASVQHSLLILICGSRYHNGTIQLIQSNENNNNNNNYDLGSVWVESGTEWRNGSFFILHWNRDDGNMVIDILNMQFKI